MIASVIVWLCVATFLIAVILYRVTEEKKNNSNRQSLRHDARKFKFIELGKEREEFFITGDKPLSMPIDDYDTIDE